MTIHSTSGRSTRTPALEWRAHPPTGLVHATIVPIGRNSMCGDVPADHLTGAAGNGSPVCETCLEIAQSVAAAIARLLADPLPSG